MSRFFAPLTVIVSLGLFGLTAQPVLAEDGCCVSRSDGIASCSQDSRDNCYGSNLSFYPNEDCSAVSLCKTVPAQDGGCNLTPEEIKQLAGSAPTIFTPDISIPGFPAGTQVEINSSTIGNYIRGIFIIFIWSVTVLSVVMVIYGGIKWVAAAGNPGQIGDAKDVVTNSIIGLVIALTSFLVLRLINPDFTSFSPLSTKKVSRCSFAMLNKITKDAGGTVNECAAGRQNLGGPPTRVAFPYTSGADYEGNLNTLIMSNSSFVRNDGARVSVDPVLIKALIMGEAAYADGNTLKSQPTGGRRCSSNTPNCQKKGTAYGIIQAIHATMIEHWQKVAGSVPADCSGDESNWGTTAGSISVACARHLDDGAKGLALQIKIMASILHDASRQFKSNPTILAAAYHLGHGGAKEFLTGGASPDEPHSASVKYVRDFNRRYKAECTELPAAPPGFNPYL